MSAALVVLILLLAVLFVLTHSKPIALLEPTRNGTDRIFVDAGDLLLALVVIGAIGTVLVGIAAWGISRRSVTPLATALRMQRAFVADASHELRTPLTVLDVRLQLLQRRLDRGEPWTPVTDALRQDVRGMIELVTDLLLLAEDSATALQTGRPTTVPLAGAIDHAVAGLDVLAAERSVSIVVTVRGAPTSALPESSLQRCLVVLLDNAVAHSPAGGLVRLEAWTQRRRAVVRVTDQGPGIEGIAPSRIFERFSHGSPAEGAVRQGFGIGLSLVRDLAVRQGGRVLVEETGAGGTTMRLELPGGRR